MRRVLSLLVAFAALAASSAPALAAPTPRQLALRIVRSGVPGAVVLIRDRTGTHAASAGFANVRTHERMRVADAFRAGSINKTFVATVVLELAGEGVLRLDDSIERWLPGLVPGGSAITLRELLNHTSGLFDYVESPGFVDGLLLNPTRVWAPRELVALATPEKPLFAPGAGWSYSNTNYVLLGLVVEAATATTLQEQLQRRIFGPLGLVHSAFPSTAALPPPFAHGYFRRRDITVWDPSAAWAAGAIVSTGPELARFYGALLGGRLLRPDLLRAMETTVDTQFGDGTEYGLGILRARTRCGIAWGHTGSVPGFNSIVLEGRLGARQAVLLVNATLVNDRQNDALFSAAGDAFCR